MVLVLTALSFMPRLLAAIGKKSMKYKNPLPTIAAILIAISLAAPASAGQLTPGDALNIFAGKKITGEYPDGKIWSEKFLPGNLTIYSEGRELMQGMVMPQNGFLCFRYPLSSETSGGCFEVWQRSATCYDFYSADPSRTRTIASLSEKQNRQAWSARGWLGESIQDCKSDPIA